MYFQKSCTNNLIGFKTKEQTTKKT